MKYISLFLFGFALIFSSLKSDAFQLSPDAEISLLTCSPSDEIYAIYGHSAIRVNDPSHGFDVVFNYGVFSFETPHFIYRFAKGHTDYMLAPERFSDFYESYKRDGRSIKAQVLNLQPDAKQRMLDFLMNNAKPENRKYRYNFFYDNCATRVRDVVENEADGKVIFPTNTGENKSFRKLVAHYQKVLPWTNFGILLVLGDPADTIASEYQEMFLPDYLEKHFAAAQIKTGDSSRPLVKETRTIYDAGSQPKRGFDPLSPFMVCFVLLLLIVGFSIYQFRIQKMNYALDYVLLFITGLAGLLLLWLVTFSEHPAMSPNYNLWWAIPTNILFMVAWAVKKWRPSLKWYWKAMAVWLILFLLFNFMIPQAFPIGAYLIVLIMLTRALLHVIWFMRLRRQIIER
ncbi:MAG TPA: DUF4105 domain-containing protein [Sunxiuqinia sp.]|nr:DUF4105 domain-containing protein [Sunxiuqinia sp.]